MTQNKIRIIEQIENLSKRGYLVDTRWAFCGYKCTIWELHNDHDSNIDLCQTFNSRWEAYKEAIKYINKHCPYNANAFS